MFGGGKLCRRSRRSVDDPSAYERREQETMPIHKAEAAWHGTFATAKAR
jgi:hypothetical protein